MQNIAPKLVLEDGLRTVALKDECDTRSSHVQHNEMPPFDAGSTQ